MQNLIIYSLEVAISLVLFYSVYWMFLRNETFFKLNRFYLLFSVILSLSLPLLNITVGGDSFLTKNFILPVKQYEHQFFGNDGEEYAQHGKEYMNGGEFVKTEQANALEGTTAPVIAARSTENGSYGKTLNWVSIGFAVYLIGVGLLLLRFLAGLGTIIFFVFRYRTQQIEGVKVIRSAKNISPYSFMNLIFIHQKEYPEGELHKIISHEKVHVRQKHSLDLILIELLLVFQWFNPIAWFYKRAVKINHEYLADEGALNSGVDLPGYQYSLLNQVLAENNFELTSSYSLSVKKRIAKMIQKRSSKLSILKVSFVLPILVLLFSAFSFKTASSPSTGKNSLVADPDTSFIEVSVPIEYLRLLEGEYVSTNDPYQERTIIFTEILGYLHGYDAGYSYKIIPLGDERFYNPDDKASLIFDSKNKNAISLLLFGKINLKKQHNAQGKTKRSMAGTITNVMLKNGVAAGLSFYKSAKDSGNYFLTEFEMNWAGYLLLQAKKLDEAAAIFKLNTELFPQSFNVYDSYAEALLELGDKTNAIENYKKSLQLNPGSKSGLAHLKELGINTDGLVKKVVVSAEYLKLLEGNYLSTNEPKFVRLIRFKVTDGVLYGNDNGYHYQLIPAGEGKFINPDDGASLVFDTKNKNAISLSLFGRINLKKVIAVTEADVDLKQYEGFYLPIAGDAVHKPIEVFQKDHKLFRKLDSDPPGPNRIVELQSVTYNTFYYTDKSGRSLEFVVNDKKEVTGCILNIPGGNFRLEKQK